MPIEPKETQLASTTIPDTYKVWVLDADSTEYRCVAVCARNYDAHRIKEVWEATDAKNVYVTRHFTQSMELQETP